MTLTWKDLQNIYKEQEDTETATDNIKRQQLELKRQQLEHKQKIDERKQALAERKQALAEQAQNLDKQNKRSAWSLWAWAFMILGSLTLEFIVLLIVLLKY